MTTVLERASRAALDAFFPPRCAVCRAYGHLLCAGCAEALPRAARPRCERCWHPGAALCYDCRRASPAFASVRAPFIMHGAARELVHQLKYEGLTSLAEPMAALMASDARVVAGVRIIPVPLHPSRERSRGYNQSERIARHLSRTLGLPLQTRAVKRVRNTPPMALGMSRDERRAAVDGAFRARAGIVDGVAVLLVDDVVTTGATLDACARALRDAGAASVDCLTFARAD